MPYRFVLPETKPQMLSEEKHFDDCYGLVLYFFRSLNQAADQDLNFIRLQNLLQKFGLDYMEKELLKMNLDAHVDDWEKFENEESLALTLLHLITTKKILCMIDSRLISVFDEPLLLTNKSVIDLIDQTAMDEMMYN